MRITAWVATGSDETSVSPCSTRVYVTDEEIAGTDLAAPYAQLLEGDLPERLEGERAAIAAGEYDLYASAFEDAVRPLPIRSRQRPHGLMSWEKPNTARDVGRCLNLTVLVGVLAHYWNHVQTLENLLHQARQSVRKSTATPKVPRRMRQLGPEQVARLVAAREAGAEINDLAREHGIHRATVIAHLNRAGVEHRTWAGRHLSPEQVRAAGQLYASGANLIDVGQQFGVDRRYLRKVLPEAGFALRRPGRQQTS